MDEQGIMALGQGMQAPTAQPMGGGLPPEVMAAFEQARGSVPPDQVSNDSLAAMQEADPGMVAEFQQALAGLQLPIEVVEALGQLVDEILANPQEYAEIREEVLSDPEVADVLDDFLPIEFDAAFFGGLNVALDQMAMSQMPMEPQGFAAGGIAQLTPIAAGLARMGRNGDTTLAHITPSEARMLRMRGGSGTINPMTGMPEFFFKKIGKAVGKVFKAVGKAVKGVVKAVGNVVKKVASSPIGRIVLTAAAVMVGGPMLATALGTSALVGGSLAAGLANTGMALASGAKLGDALKQGVIAGATVYAGGKLMNAFSGPGQAPAPIESYDVATGIKTGASGSGLSTLPSTTSMAAEGIATPSSPMGTDTIAMPSSPLASSPSIAPTAPSVGAEPGYLGSGIGGTATPVQPGVDYSLMGGSSAMPSYMQTPSALAATQAPAPITTATAASPAVPGVFESLKSAGSNIAGGQYLDAAGNLKDVFFGTPTRTIATGLAGLSLTGGFNQEPVEPPGIVPKETGYDLLRQDPEAFGTSPGGAQTTFAALPNYAPFTPQFRPVQLNPVRYPEFQPRYAAQGGEIQSFADGGIASLPKGMQPITIYYDSNENRYVMPKPEAINQTSPRFSGIAGIFRKLFSRLRDRKDNYANYVPFDPALFTSGMSPQAFVQSQQQAAAAAAAQPPRPFFTPGGAASVPIQSSNLAGTAGLAVEQQPQQMFANGGIAALAPRRFNVGGFAGGGPSKFPRRIGQIDGPGTETSDDIPAMLSDGEFVMTAKAVRGAGNGSRRDGAKRMYQMMHKLERAA